MPCISFGASERYYQDRSGRPLILNVEADYHKQLEEALIDPMRSVDNQPSVEKPYATAGLLSAINNAGEFTKDTVEFLLGDYD